MPNSHSRFNGHACLQAYTSDNRIAAGFADSMTVALLSDELATGFLARVQREQPRAKTRVTAAKRALNLLRALGNTGPLDDNIRVRFLARSAANAVVSTVRKSPPAPLDFIRAITEKWGSAPEWWKRQVTLMILASMCAIARAGGSCECLKHGLSWVRADGTLEHDSRFIPPTICHNMRCVKPSCVRGLLLLLPFRKNKQSTPSWMPILERNTLRILCEHLRFLRRERVTSAHLFVPRRKRIVRGVHVFVPATNSPTPMTPNQLRSLFRQAIVECCGLTPTQAAMFGTHSVKNGAVEALRASGVQSETRRQLGDWMSPAVALSYLQLNPNAQFSLIRSIN